MKTLKSEKQVLKRLGIADISQLREEMIPQLAGLLIQCTPDLAKKILDSVPDFAATLRELVSWYKEMAVNSYNLAQAAQEALSTNCNYVLASFDRELQNTELDASERNRIEDKMIYVLLILKDNTVESRNIFSMIAEFTQQHLGEIALTAGVVGSVLYYSIFSKNDNKNDDEDHVDYIDDSAEDVQGSKDEELEGSA